MRFGTGESKHGANAGLTEAQAALEPLKKKYPNISNADFWSLAAIVAIKVMGGPDISWRAGRPDADSADDSVPDGRLPDATQGCPHLRSVFHRMGFSDQDIVALSGAHAVGMCHADRSGFIGPWTTTPLSFDNAYFIWLTQRKWHKTKQANGLEVYVTDSQRGVIMLPTDVALLTDKNMVPWVELYANDKARWERDFATAFTKLQELGVKRFHEG
jgi:catalase (peroxidase I)